MMRSIKRQGFTLLEMMVTIALISLISIVLSQVFISTLRSNKKTDILKEVKQNGNLALESMSRMIQNAKRVTCVTANTLAIVNPDGETTTISCLLDDANTRLASSSASQTVFLSSPQVSLGGVVCESSSLQFTCDDTSGLPSRVTVVFHLSQAGSPGDQFEQASEDFQTSVTMRNNP